MTEGGPPDLGAELEIDVETLQALRETGAPHQLLDIREDWERDICALDGAIAVPMVAVPQSLARLRDDAPVVVLCHLGGRSLQVAAWLRANGFGRAVSVRGGIDAWAREVAPEMALY